jgi:protein involved in polysaccharide export with SLBB domain
MMKKFLFYVLLTLSTTQLYGQANKKVDPTIIRAEISKRGFTETEVTEKLRSKGVDLDIDNVSMDKLQSVRKQVESAMLELEAEKKIDDDKNTGAEKPQMTEKEKAAAEKAGEEKDKKVVRKEAKEVAGKSATEIAREVKAGASLEEAIGEKLAQAGRDSVLPATTIWGQHAFRHKQIPVFVADKTYQTPESYILGTDDKVTISIASPRVFYNQSFVINKQGAIAPDKMPRINLKGVTYGRLKQIIASAYRPYYSFLPEHLDVIVSGTRTVSVNVVGEVLNPGTFTMSALNTGFNALVFAQGPTNIGSVRNIQLIRAGGQRKTIDIYEYLTNPSVSKDFFLTDNDYVSVPVAEKLITIKGAIVRPLKYELLKSENLNKLIFYAGGTLDHAYLTTLQVKRFVNDKEKIIDIPYSDLKASGRDFDLMNGDVVTIKAIPKVFENFATVTGAVDLQGQYEISSGMRISELLKKSILKKDARLDAAYLRRVNKDLTFKTELLNLQDILAKPYGDKDISLQDKDQVYIFSLDRYTRKDSVTVSGAVRSIGGVKYPYDPSKSLKVSDLIIMAGGLRPDATPFAYIVRPDTSNSKIVSYVRINDIKVALETPTSAENITLMPNDELRIFSKLSYTDTAHIKVSGAVRQPGEYKYDETLTLKDILTMSGGVRMEADLGKVEVFRIDLEKNLRTTATTVTIDKNLNVNSGDANFQLKPYDQVVVRTVPKFHLQRYVTLNGEVNYPGDYALVKENETLGELILRAGNYTTEAFPAGATLFRNEDNVGYIILDHKKMAGGKFASFDLPIREGDLIEIPKSKDYVTILGATKAYEQYEEKIAASGKINVAFVGSKSAYYYVERYAAGVHKDGRKRLITVRHPNGQLRKTKNYGLFKIYPYVQKGSVINVGYAEVKTKDKSTKEPVDWNKTIADILSKTTAILSMVLLYKSVTK